MFSWCAPSLDTARQTLQGLTGQLPLHSELRDLDREFAAVAGDGSQDEGSRVVEAAQRLAESFPWVPGHLEIHEGRHPQAYCRPDPARFDLWGGDFTRVAGCILPSRSVSMSRSQCYYHTAHEAMHTVAYTSPVEDAGILLRNLYDAERLESFADLGTALGQTETGSQSLAGCLFPDDPERASRLAPPLRAVFAAHGRRMAFWRATYRIVEDALMCGRPVVEIEQVFMDCLAAGNSFYTELEGFEKTWPIVGLFRVPFGTHPHLMAGREVDRLRTRLEQEDPRWGDIQRPTLAVFLRARGREADWNAVKTARN